MFFIWTLKAFRSAGGKAWAGMEQAGKRLGLRVMVQAYDTSARLKRGITSRYEPIYRAVTEAFNK